MAVAIGFAIAYLVQAGPGEPKEISFSILVSSPGDFTVTMGPTNPETGDVEVDVPRGTPAVFTVTVTPVDGWDVPVNLSIDGLPDGIEYAFSQNPVPAAGGTVTLTVQTTNLASNHGYVCVLTASGE